MTIPDADSAGRLIGSFALAEDSLILRVNDTAVTWLGFSREELVGQPLRVVLGDGGQFFLQSQILPMLKLKGSLEEVYLRIREKSGGTVLANAVRLERDGNVVIEVSFMRIRQRGKLEDELLLARKLAEQASDAKTKFLGMMSHELRNPLQTITLNNELFLAGEYGPLTAQQIQVLESSQADTDSLVVLIDDILDFARMQGGPVQVTMEDLIVGRVLNRVETTIRHRFEQAGVACERDSKGDDLVMRGDAQRVQQILLNLINNALKFTPRPGRVTLSSRRDGAFVAIDITDTGCGIPEEQLQRIFEPFVQLGATVAASEKTGVGLGLAICHDLARAMGGSMQVRSSIGAGSTFSVLLPAAAQGT